jgi:DNA-directed RNA polymerase subunit RPC12/RpoP
MKRIFERIKYVVLFMVFLMPVFTLNVSAKNYYSSAAAKTPLGIFLSVLSPILVALAVAVIKMSDKSYEKRRKNSQFFKDNSSEHFFYNSTDSINMMNGNTNVFDPRLSDAENIMLKQFESQAKLRHPDPVSSSCPNCGAPISISDKAFCPYCRSNVVNKIVYNNQDDKKPKPISPENYNPKRYYDENVTGYEPRSMENSSGDDRNGGYSFTAHGNNSGFFYNGDDNSYPPDNNYDDNYANRNYNGYYRGNRYNGDNNSNNNRW